MIILDTHVWLWWINRDENSPSKFPLYRELGDKLVC